MLTHLDIERNSYAVFDHIPLYTDDSKLIPLFFLFHHEQ